MYLGHFAMGLAAKPVAPKASLGILLVATQVLDILYPIFLIAGASYIGASPWDHGLVMTLVWSVAALAIYFLIYRDIRSGIVVGLLVLSHWVCDFISWDNALPLGFSDTPKVGLGLYSSLPIMLAGDFGLFGGALAIYLLKTRADDRTGKWAPWILTAYIIALIPACTLPGKLLIITALGMLMVVPLGIWIDRHRSVIPARGKQRGAKDGAGQPAGGHK